MTERLVEFRLCSEGAKSTPELCSHCGKHPVIDGKHYCKSCLAECEERRPQFKYEGQMICMGDAVRMTVGKGGSHE